MSAVQQIMLAQSKTKWYTPTTNTIARYKLDWDTNDSSWNARNFTPQNITYSTWKLGQWAVFNWTTSYMNMPVNNTAFDLTTWTFHFFVKLAITTSAYHQLLDHWDETTWSWAYKWFSIHHWSNGTAFRTWVVISNWTSWNFTENLITYWTADTNWHLISVTLTWTTTKIYMDWVLKSTKTDHSSVNYSSNPVLTIGKADNEYSPDSNYLNWMLDEIIIENVLQNDTWVLAHYNLY